MLLVAHAGAGQPSVLLDDQIHGPLPPRPKGSHPISPACAPHHEKEVQTAYAVSLPGRNLKGVGSANRDRAQPQRIAAAAQDVHIYRASIVAPDPDRRGLRRRPTWRECTPVRGESEGRDEAVGDASHGGLRREWLRTCVAVPCT